MNIDSFFNDTFDGIYFSPNIEKGTQKDPDNELKSFTKQNAIQPKTDFCKPSHPSPALSISQCLSQKFPLDLGEEISVDDSVFLSECFSSTFETSSSKPSANSSGDDIFEEEVDTHSNIIQKEANTDNSLSTKDSLHEEPEFSCNLNTNSLQNRNPPQNYEFNPERLSLTHWGLPEIVLEKYRSRKVSKMFKWQFECLNNENVLINNSNLVYSAPTSAGKTLVAEILAIKTVLERHKKVIFILPFVSVVREKAFYFQDILGPAGVRVEGFMGSYNPPGGIQSVQVAICTIEKGNSLVNRMLEEGTLNKLGTIVVDEMHLLGDPSRGYLLELLLTKLLYMTHRNEDVNIQIIGMSATLPNLKDLANWLQAELYTTTFRPIPLYEKCYIAGEIYNSELKLERRLSQLPGLEADTDNILQLCLETLEESCSVLIFCPTKNWCETLSQQISVAFWKLGSSKSELGLILRKQLNTEKIVELLEQLRLSPVGLDAVLKRTVSFGVAFHHAGLTMDERDIIEGAFRNGTLRVLVATSALSSGVNLPAKRVIIRTPIFHGNPIDTLIYRQMIGRAGRLGKDTSGESILISQKNDFRIVKELVSAQLNPVVSCLEGAGKLKRALLEVIASGVVSTSEDLKLFANCTLLGFSENENSISNPVVDSIEFLQRNQFIRLQEQEDGSLKYIATALARACLSSSIPPEEGLALFTELEKARQCFVLESELHLIYLVTPYSVCNQWSTIDWMLFLEMWEKLPVSMKRVGELVGISESYIINATRGKNKSSTSKAHHKLQIHKRFYTALALQDLVNEVPLGSVAAKFNCARGMLQSLQHSASTFAGMVTAFSRKLGWSCIEILVSQFQDRLQFGVSRDLLDLMRLPILNGPRARALFNGGIETLAQLATSSVCEIENILHTMAPFESEKERDGETEYEAQKRNKIRNIWITGMDGLTEKDFSRVLIQDARNYLQIEMGFKDAKWSVDEEVVLEENKTGIHEQQSIKKHEQQSIKKNDIKENTEEHKLLEEKEVCSQTKGGNECVENRKQNNINKDTRKSIPTENQLYFKDSSTPLDNKNKYETNNAKDDSSDESFTLQLSANSSLERKYIIKDDKNKAESFEFSDLNFSDSSFQKSGNKIVHINHEVPASSEQKKRNSSDSGLEEVVNVSFIEKAFLTSFDLNTSFSDKEDDDIFDDDLIANSQENVLTPYNNDKSCTRKSMKIRSSEDFSGIVTPSKKKKISNSPLNKYSKEKFKAVTNLFKQEDKSVISQINIVNVCENRELFRTFSKELMMQSKIALSVACNSTVENKPSIGSNILHPRNNLNDPKEKHQNSEFVHQIRTVVGVSLSWGENNSYFLSFRRTAIKNNEKIQILRNILENRSKTICMFDCKEQIKVLKRCCELNVCTYIEDPKIGDWILDPEGKEKSLQSMVLHYCCSLINLYEFSGTCKGVSSIGLDFNSCVDSKLRSSIEAIISWYIVDSIKNVLINQNPILLDTYKTEMENLLCLTYMELNGIGVSLSILQQLVDSLKTQCLVLERQAFSLAGRRFSLTSSKEVGKVLGLYKGNKVSTSKQVLEKTDNPIAKIIIQWRKLNSTLTRMLYPLIRMVQNDRIHGTCITHSATGRISMHEPNLQNIPRNFEIINPISNDVLSSISCRDAFVAPKGYLLLSADYCQLELRLLAHLSRDKTLCSIMRTNEDVFKSIAAKTNNINESEVTDTLRQRAKQICYGIIYGMGTKALAEQLSVNEEEALEFIETFHSKYPSIKKFINDVVSRCKEVGYVETLAGRRRYLPNIIDENVANRSQAERQSINTTIQGSAADIAKKAIVLINDNFNRKFKSQSPKLVLQLHDEFLYEVHENNLKESARILKKSMENAVNLSIPFPVKLKKGFSWGKMNEMVS